MLYFDREVVRKVLELAAQFPDGLDSFEGYKEVLRVLGSGTSAQGKWQAVFPELVDG